MKTLSGPAIFLAQVTALGGKVIFGSLIIVVGIFLANIIATLVGSGTGEGGYAQVLVRYSIIALFTAIGLTFMGLADHANPQIGGEDSLVLRQTFKLEL